MGAFLPQVVFRWYKPDNTPAFGYTAGFYGAGLSPDPGNLKDVYDDPSATTPIPNPVPFDVEGIAGQSGTKKPVILGAGAYKVVIRNELAATVATFDNVPGEGGFGTGFVSSIDDLRDVLSFDPGFVYVAGYYAPGDGGHRMFYWDSTDATADDGGYTIAPTSNPVTGRWKGIPDENGDVRAASFGFDQGTGSDLTTKMQAADAYATAQGRRLRIDVGSGTAQIDAMTFNAPRVAFEGRGLKGVLAVPAVVFNSLVEGPPAFLFERMTVTFNHPDQVAMPEWWNTIRNDVTPPIPAENLVKIDAMFASGAERFLFADGFYEVSALPAFPATGTIESFGTVTQGATVHVAPGIRIIGAGGLLRAETLTADADVNAGADVNAVGDVNAANATIATLLTSVTGRFTGRLKMAQGADVAVANPLILGTDGNHFLISGVGTISKITTTDWTTGSIVVLRFDGIVTVKNAMTGTGEIRLNAGGAFVGTNDSTLTLILSNRSGTLTWYEIGRMKP